MQYLSVKLSEATRLRIGIVMFLLNVAIIVLCHATGAMGIHMRQQVSSLHNFLAFYNTSSLFRLLFSVSVLLALLHLAGAKICYDCAFFETRERFHSVLFYWLVVVLALLPLTVATCVTLAVHQHTVLQATEHGFLRVMQKFKVDRSMREFVHRLQVQHRCCGARSHQDWWAVNWVDYTSAAPPDAVAKHFVVQPNGDFKPFWAPFSCCRLSSVGAPCASVFDVMYLYPHTTKWWLKKSRTYSLFYLQYYKQYLKVFDRVQKYAGDNPKKPVSKEILQKGKDAIDKRYRAFIKFLREGTTQKERPPAVDEHFKDYKTQKPSEKLKLRLVYESYGIQTFLFPTRTLTDKTFGAPYEGQLSWTQLNISNIEAFNQHFLIAGDGRNYEQLRNLLRWRSFYQTGCARPIAHGARLTMRVTCILFTCVAVIQLVVVLAGRYIQTSIDNAYRWGNPLQSTPGYLLNTSQASKPEKKAGIADRRQGKRLLKEMSPDLAEGSMTTLLSPSLNFSELDDEEEEDEEFGTSGRATASVGKHRAQAGKTESKTKSQITISESDHSKKKHDTTDKKKSEKRDKKKSEKGKKKSTPTKSKDDKKSKKVKNSSQKTAKGKKKSDKSSKKPSSKSKPKAKKASGKSSKKSSPKKSKGKGKSAKSSKKANKTSQKKKKTASKKPKKKATKKAGKRKKKSKKKKK